MQNFVLSSVLFLAFKNGLGLKYISDNKSFEFELFLDYSYSHISMSAATVFYYNCTVLVF